MLRRKLQERRKCDNIWPENPEKLISRIETKFLPEMYNANYF